MLNDQAIMLAAFHIALHVALIAAILGKFALLWIVIVSFSSSTQEKIMRSVAATCGLLLYVGSMAAGVSIPTFMLHALTLGGAYTAGFIGALLPAAAGFVVAWVSCRYFSSRDARKNVIAMRILTMGLTISLFLFLDCYIAATDAARSGGMALLGPNLTFALAVMLVAVFRFHPATEEGTYKPSALADDA